MKITHKDLKKGELKLVIDNLDDIWTLSQIIEPGDFVKGKSERKIKIGDYIDRNIKVVRKTVFLKIKIKKIEISETTKNLRVLGIITDGPEDVPRGEHHTFNLGENNSFTLIKDEWLKYQIEKIEEATKSVQQNIIMVVFDREDAYFARLKGDGYELIMKMSGDVQKKEEKHVSKNDFYKQISNKLEEYNKTLKINNFIIASPSFWKENLLKALSDEIKKKTISASVSQANERALSELMKRNELQKVLEKNKGAQEIKQMDELLKNISNDFACYGFKETNEQINLGSVKDLFVSYSTIQKYRLEDKFKKLAEMMKVCEGMDGKVHIISSKEAEKTLKSLSGIAGILRWKN